MTKSNDKVFISGGAGFIGSALARRLLDQGKSVVVFDNFKRNSFNYFPKYLKHPNLQMIQGDVRDLGALKQAVQDCTYVYHLAAIAGVSKYFTIPAEVMEVNVIGTYNMLEAIKNNKNVKLFLDFSTSESYGSNCFNAKEEGDVRMENLSEKRWTYATSKIASEKFGMSYYWQYGVPFVGIRPFNIYGPGQVGEGVVSYFTTSILNNEPIKITGDGSQSRTMCYIEDFLDGLELLANNREKVIGQSYNIGVNTEIFSVLSLAEMIQEITGKQVGTTFVKHTGEDVMVRSPNIDKIKALGFAPKVGLRQGLKQTFDWYAEFKVKVD